MTLAVYQLLMSLLQCVNSQVSTNLFSYKPMLACLQGMTCIPFAPELVHRQVPSPPLYLPAEAVEKVRLWRKYCRWISNLN